MSQQQADAKHALDTAIAEENAAMEQVGKALRALESARQHLSESLEKTRKARVDSDAFLTKCTIVVSKRYGSGGVERIPGVVVRRTAKEITVRAIGEGPSDEKRYRKNKFNSERWGIYPSEKGICSATRFVEFDDEGVSTDKAEA